LAYKLFYKSSVEKDLKGLPKERKAKILKKIEKDLAMDPKGKGKPLKGKWKGLWRYEVWPYRVIYSISTDSILILRIRHRKEVYRKH